MAASEAGRGRDAKTGAWRVAVAVERLALVADEEIFQQLLGFVGVAVLQQLLQPHGEQHLWRGRWEVGSGRG